MHKYYLDCSLNAAREMINAYYVDKNVDKLFEYINPKNFTWNGYDTDISFSNAKDFRKYAEDSLSHLNFYNLIDENYSVSGETQDSCFIIAKIKLFDTRTQKNFELDFFFYFQQVGNVILCSHYHVTRPLNTKIDSNSIFFKRNSPAPFFSVEIQSFNEDLLNFITSNAVAEKSFYCEENFPYRFVNREFINLLGYEKISEFITEENISTLINIHAADQRKYVEYLRTVYEKNVGRFGFDQQYQYQNSYFVKYRLQSPRLSEEVSVLEWGNFFTLNGRTIVNCFVLNFAEVKNISSAKEKADTIPESISLREDFGIHIGKNIIAYPMSHQIKIGGATVELTQVESEIFFVLADNLNRSISMEKIYAI